MPDALEQFFNGDVTFAQLTAGHPIVTNSASQQAVVRDIQFTKPGMAAALDVNVAGTRVAMAQANEDVLSGSEIVPSSATMTVSTRVAALFNRLLRVNSTTHHQTDSIGSVFYPPMPASEMSGVIDVSGGTAFSAALSLTPTDIFFDAAGDFYYGSGSSIHRRAGGLNGVDTFILGTDTNSAFDGRYIYMLPNSGTVVRRYDTQTHTLLSGVTRTGAPLSLSNSSGRTTAIDDFLIYCRSETGNYVSVNTLTGACVNIPVSWGTDNNTSPIQTLITKAQNGDYVLFIVMGGSTGTIRWCNLGPSLSTPFAKASGTFTRGNLGANVAGRCWFTMPTRRDIAVLTNITGDQVRFVDVNTMTVGPEINVVVTNRSGNNAIWPRLDAAQAGTDFGTTRIRATGIRIT